MKVLLDTCIWGGARTVLEVAKHEVDWAGDWSEDPGDDELLRRAHEQGRVLATLDKDFGELAMAQRMTHCGIVRLVGIRARNQGPTLVEIHQSYESEDRPLLRRRG